MFGSTRLSRLPRGLALRHIVPRAGILSPSRTLCNASDTPAREPSEATLDPVVDAVPTRPRDILSPDDESKPQPYTKMQRAAIGASCAACFSGGALSLGWQHWAFMQPYLVDVMGLSLIGASVVLGREAFLKKGKKDRSAAELPERDGGWNLELIPLNDEARYAAAAGALQAHLVAKAAADDAAKAGKLDAALAAAEKEAKEQADASRKEKAEALIKEAADEVAAGLAPCAAPRDPLPRTQARTRTRSPHCSFDSSASPPGRSRRRVRQRLAPRVFVVDFDTRGPPRGGADGRAPRPPPTMRAMLDKLREQVNLLLHVASPYDEVRAAAAASAATTAHRPSPACRRCRCCCCVPTANPDPDLALGRWCCA